MQTIKRYVSCDGRTFDDRFACARHELEIRPGLLTQLAEKLKGRHISEQGNWCGGDPENRYGAYACGCMGCANGSFYALGLQYEHWKVWFDELRGEQPGDNIPNLNTDVDVILEAIGPERIKVYNIIRETTGLGILEAKNLMDTPNAVIISDSDYYFGNKLLEKLTAAGATAKMEVAQNQRWTRIA